MFVYLYDITMEDSSLEIFFKIIQFINLLSQRLKFNSGYLISRGLSIKCIYTIRYNNERFVVRNIEDFSKYELIQFTNPLAQTFNSMFNFIENRAYPSTSYLNVSIFIRFDATTRDLSFEISRIFQNTN